MAWGVTPATWGWKSLKSHFNLLLSISSKAATGLSGDERMSTRIVYWGMPPSAAGDLGGKHLSQRPSPSGLTGVSRAKPRLTPRAVRPHVLASSSRDGLVICSEGTQRKTLWDAAPLCCSQSLPEGSFGGNAAYFSKEEELATDQRRFCSHEVRRFGPSSPGSLPDGTQNPCKAANPETVICMSVLETDAKTSSRGATPTSKPLKDRRTQRSSDRLNIA